MGGKKTSWRARFGVFGDLPTRLLTSTLGMVPWFLEPVLVAGWTLLFFILAKPQRRAVVSNLRAMHAGWGPMRGLIGAWQVFWNFSMTFLDALRWETGTGGVDWEVNGLDAIKSLSERKEGCVILTAHMGNYDLAAPVFAERLKRTLYTVRAPEREPEMQRIREEEIRRKEARYPLFRTLYNQDGNLIGVELARLLAEGHIVAVQGDRVMFDVSPMEVEVAPGLKMRLPKGPLFLTRATNSPCYPVFMTRTGWRRYQVTVLPEIQLPPRRRGDEAEVAKLWAAIVFETAKRHWNQWFVFEHLLERVSVDKDRLPDPAA